MPGPKPRRRFAFGLRTVFIVVAIFAVPCGWFAYQLSWLRERHAVLARPDVESYYIGFGTPSRSAPWPLRMFGEAPYLSVTIVIVDPDRTANEEGERVARDDARLTPCEREYLGQIHRLFPEAETRALFMKTQPLPSFLGTHALAEGPRYE